MDTPIALPQAQWEALHESYRTPPRAYHHFGHVEEVLERYDEVARAAGWWHPREVWLAVLYHDAIYEPGRDDNEARSAQLAREAIARWLPDEGVDARRVAMLIELTARHGKLAPDDVDAEAALFLDCDMAILGASPDRFDAYDAAIRREYRHVPGPLYRLHRRRFLKGLLARERIFLSDFFHQRLDAAARSNLRRALSGKR